MDTFRTILCGFCERFSGDENDTAMVYVHTYCLSKDVCAFECYLTQAQERLFDVKLQTKGSGGVRSFFNATHMLAL